MTGASWGLVALNSWFTAAGFALLYGFGFVRSFRSAVRYLGLALCVGWAAVGVCATLALLVGIPPSEALVLVLATAVAGVGVAAGRRTRAAPIPTRKRHWTDALALPAVAGIGFYALKLFQRARLDAITEWDVWSGWMPKAQSIAYFDGLDTDVGGYLSFGQTHYPPLSPTQDAIAFEFMHRVEPLLLPQHHAVFAIAAFWAIGALLAGRVAPAVLWPALLMVMIPRDVAYLIGSSLGDEPLAFTFALAGMCGLLWLKEADDRFAALAALFLAAAALTKNEGLLLGLVLAVALSLASWRHVRERWRALAAMVAAPVLVQLAWKVWIAAKDVDVTADYSLLDLGRPSYLFNRLDRLEFTMRELPGYLFGPEAWNYMVPLLLVAAALALTATPRLVVAVVGTAAIAFFGLAAVYWIGRQDVAWWIDTSARRVVSSVALFCGVAFPLLLDAAIRGRPAVERDPPAATSAS